MISKKTLQENKIFDWDNVQSNFTGPPDLLLGNGFTLQFSDKFSYSSLFEKFLDKCSTKDKQLFQQFKTNDFELIQKHLLYAYNVNTILNLPIAQIEEAIQKLKDGLIETIEEVHPRSETIDFDQLKKIAEQLVFFGDIYTVNYDLYLYRIIMLSQDVRREFNENENNYMSYQDYFWGECTSRDFRRFMNFQNYETYKNIYYLHGALFIFKKEYLDVKFIRNQEVELIERISDEIRRGNFPTFISESTGEDKLLNIRRNTYLSFCLDKLKSSTNPIMIFGTSLGDVDSHILDAIQTRGKEIIYCIYCGRGKTIHDIIIEKEDFLSGSNHSHKVTFINSESVFDI